MLELIKSLFSTKVRLRVVIRVPSKEALYPLQNLIKSFGIPGIARVLPGQTALDVEWEGPESTLRRVVQDLMHSPFLSGEHFMRASWHSYTGRFNSFTIAY